MTEDALTSDEEDILLVTLIERLQKIIADTEPEERSTLKCGVRSYWTDVGGYLAVYKRGEIK
jgi:hypothetical protein